MLGTEPSADDLAPCTARLRESQVLGHDGQFGCDKFGDGPTGGLPGTQCGIHFDHWNVTEGATTAMALSVNSSSPCWKPSTVTITSRN